MSIVDVESCTLLISSIHHVGGFARTLIAPVWLLMLRVIGGASLVTAVSMLGMTPSTAGMKLAGERVIFAMPNLVLFLGFGSLSA